MAASKTLWAQIPIGVKIAGVGLAALLTFRFVNYQITAIERDKRRRNIDSKFNYTFQDSYGNAQSINIDLGTAAATIYDAFYNNDWFGWTEDEERAIRTLLPIPKSLIPDLADIYYKLYKKILKEDFIKYLSDEEYRQVSDKFI